GGEDLYLVRLNSLGDVLWDKRFGGSGSDVGWSVKELANGGFIVAGVTDSFSFSDKREQAYILVIDASGDLLWQNNYGNDLSQYGYDVEPASNGDFVMSGYSSNLTSGYTYYLIRVSQNGQLLWEKTFGSTDSLFNRNDMVIDGDENYIITGNKGFNVHLYRLNSSGDQLWFREFNWSTYLTICTASSVSLTADGGYLIAGSAWPNSGKDFLLIKTDSSGNASPTGI
ncbi:MAG: hypothetical protein PHU01_14380, partial [Desulfuromonadaceae bacterium]|nr:hypothetical protein [Desulfuromonadaceae bacterium]